MRYTAHAVRASGLVWRDGKSAELTLRTGIALMGNAPTDPFDPSMEASQASRSRKGLEREQAGYVRVLKIAKQKP